MGWDLVIAQVYPKPTDSAPLFGKRGFGQHDPAQRRRPGPLRALAALPFLTGENDSKKISLHLGMG